MLMWSYVRWLVNGYPRCLYCPEQPAVKGFFCMACQQRLEEFLTKRRGMVKPLGGQGLQ